MAKSKVNKAGRCTSPLTDREIASAVKRWNRDGLTIDRVYESAFGNGPIENDIFDPIKRKLGCKIASERAKEFHSIEVHADIYSVKMASNWMFDHNIGCADGTAFREVSYLSILPGIIEHIDEVAHDSAVFGCHDNLLAAISSLRGFLQKILDALDRVKVTDESS